MNVSRTAYLSGLCSSLLIRISIILIMKKMTVITTLMNKGFSIIYVELTKYSRENYDLTTAHVACGCGFAVYGRAASKKPQMNASRVSNTPHSFMV